MKRTLTVAVLALVSVCLGAQNLNTTVDVSNEYSSSFAGLTKQNLEMSIPDSLLQFNKDFEYFTFDNAYKGSYKFVPYSVVLKPEKGTYGSRNFYLVAGAGYQLRPVLKFVATPKRKEDSKFGINFYQDGGGYMGQYVDLGKGYRFTEKLGADMVASFKKATLRANIMFDGGMTCTPKLIGDLNVGDFKSDMYSGVAELSVNSIGTKKVYYSADVRYTYAYIQKKYSTTNIRSEHFIEANATVEPYLGKVFRIPVDVEFQANSNMDVAVIPHFKLSIGVFNIDVGARFDYLSYSNSKEGQETASDVNVKNVTIHPDVSLDLALVKKALDIYVVATGGRKLYGSKDIYSYNPFLYQHCDAYSEESLNAFGGIRGHIANRFEYDANVGYDFIASAPFCAYVPGMTYSAIKQEKMKLFYVNAKLAWRSEHLDVDGTFRYNYSDWDGSSECLDLPQYKADLRAKYNINNLFYIGVNANYSSRRVSTICYNESAIPAYIDLGASLEYRFTRQFSVWVQGKNLLSQKINLYPGYAEQGIGVVAGISLNL